MSIIRNVCVVGMGVIGSQIAYQTAFHGYTVTVYDVSDEVILNAGSRFTRLAELYEADGVPGAEEGKSATALSNIRIAFALGDAVADADLVIEAVSESLELKRKFYGELGELAPSRTIFATNTSSLLPSDLKTFTGRPDRFLALHYANRVWRHNTAEIMGTDDTDPVVYRAVVDFAEGSGLVPVEIRKEKAGYVLNSLLIPLLDAAGSLLVDGFASAETIDKTWRIGTGAPLGPFEILDIVGLGTAYSIASAHPDPHKQRFARYLKDNFIDKGRRGVESGEGFYSY